MNRGCHRCRRGVPFDSYTGGRAAAAEGDPVPVLQPESIGNGVVVDEGSVATAKIPDEPASVLEKKDGVVRGNREVVRRVEAEVDLRVAPDPDRWLGKGEILAGTGSGQDGELDFQGEPLRAVGRVTRCQRAS